MKKKVIIAVVILIVVLLTALAIRRTGTKADDGVISASGNVEVTEVNIAFKNAGRVEAIFTDEGRLVEKGEKLASLDSEEYASQVAQNRANFRNLQAHLDKTKKDLRRYEVLAQKEAISAQQLDAARTAYDAALAQSQQAAAAVRTSEVRMNDAVIYASAPGVVLRRNIEPGETIQAGVALITIGDLGNPWIKVYVKEDKLGQVKLGQNASITTDSYPGKTYEGTVSYISSEAEFTPKNVQTQEERVKLVFGVKVSVRNEHFELKPGMPADVKIYLR